MKAYRSPVTIALLALLQACSNTVTEETSEAPSIVASLDNPESIQAQPFILRGEVVVGHEVRTISPCGSQQQYWLNMPSDLVEQAIFLTRSPYQPMYGEMIGYLTPSSHHGFDSDYSAVFQVESVNLLAAENPNRCDSPQKPTTAFGTEPFWSASFEQQGLVFKIMGEEKASYQVMGSTISEQIKQQQRTYRLSDDGRLEMKQEICSDGMSDSLYGWQASLDSDQGKFTGCATLANQDHSESWIGYYHAESADNPLFNVHLELNADHSAITTYEYLDGQPSTIERGFWQQLNPDQVQVTMTRHQQQYLVSERIFTRNGGQLTAKQEKVSDIVYPIADGGLTLFKVKPTSTDATPLIQSSQMPAAQTVDGSAQFDSKVDATLRKYFTMHKTDPANIKYRWLEHDLNGDGAPELLVLLDWCGTGGCTLLIFEDHQQEWRFNSRITLVNTPIRIANTQSNGWQDLVFDVYRGGMEAGQHKLSYGEVSYPINPSVAPIINPQDISGVVLFADETYPTQKGVVM
ncbi:COG3650 family protein [Vibrio astriarenae]